MAGRSEAQKRIDRYFPMNEPIAYQPSLNLVFKSTNAGLFLYQLLYWSGKQADKNGWIRKSTKEMKAETGLTRDQQETATKILKKHDIIETKVFWNPATRHVRIKFEVLENHLTSLLETNKLDGSIPSNKSADIQQTITKTTQKTTTKKKDSDLYKLIPKEIIPEFKFFIEMRKEKNKPVTKRAVELILTRLNGWYPDNFDSQKACIEKSIENGWTSVHELKIEKPKGKVIF